MHRHMAIAHFGHDAKRQASQPRQELGGFRRMRARMQLAHDLVRAIGHARRRVGWIAAAATGIVLGGRLGFDVAKGCDVRHAAHGAIRRAQARRRLRLHHRPIQASSLGSIRATTKP